MSKNSVRYRKPKPFKNNGVNTQNKHCKFHEDSRHRTNDYFALKNGIERLIRKGYLREYIKRVYPLAGTPNQHTDTRTEGYVNQIYGGRYPGGYTQSSRKDYVFAAGSRPSNNVYHIG